MRGTFTFSMRASEGVFKVIFLIVPSKKIKLQVFLLWQLEVYTAKKLSFAERYHFFHLKLKFCSYVDFAAFIKKKAAFCELNNFHVLYLNLVLKINDNDVALSENFLKIRNCTLEQAFPIAQNKKNVANGSVCVRNESSPLINSNLILLQCCHNHKPKIFVTA